MTAAAQGTRVTALPNPHVHPHEVANAAYAVAQLGAIPVVVTDPAALGSCWACAPLQVGGPDPAVAVLCHREVDDDRSWVHRWPLCGAHLVREAAPVLAKKVPIWVEVCEVLEP